MSNKKYLVLSEVSKKQSYIFKSNKLKENIGASVIIEYITEDLPKLYLKKYNGEEVYEGGGSSIFSFTDELNTINFINAVTKHVLKQFPGVEFFMSYKEFDYDKTDIRNTIDELYELLNDKKNKRESVFKRYSYGIEEKCKTTGLPSLIPTELLEKSEETLSREADVKRAWSKKEYRDLVMLDGDNLKLDKKESTIEKLDTSDYKFPLKIDDLGSKKGESSYVAIVSMDGNQMGAKLQKFKDEFEQKNNTLKETNLAKFNENYTSELKDFSDKIKKYYKSSFEVMLKKIIDKYHNLREDKEFNLKDNYLPIRPIILAGDDVCFVCDSRIALECVNTFIEALNKYEIQDMQLNACAGICIVKQNYPFSKAYDIAESLCKSSKAKIKDMDISLIDWHVSQADIPDSLSQIRSKISIDKSINLHVKPIYINPKDETSKYFNYKNFKKEVLRLKAYEETSKNKIRRARDIFPQGKEKSRIFINKYNLESVFNSGFEKSDVEYGFSGDDCLYFDAIEIVDLFKDLD